MVKKIIVGAHYGFGSWLAQRITAAVMAVCTLVFVAMLLIVQPAGYAAWRDLFAPEWMKIATLLFFLSLCYHAWVGMRDILMDYAKPAALRLVLYVLVVLMLAGYAGWAMHIIWRA